MGITLAGGLYLRLDCCFNHGVEWLMPKSLTGSEAERNHWERQGRWNREREQHEGGASGLRGGAAGSGGDGCLPRMAFHHYSPLSQPHCHRHQCSVSPTMGLFLDGCKFSSLSPFFFSNSNSYLLHNSPKKEKEKRTVLLEAWLSQLF